MGQGARSRNIRKGARPPPCCRCCGARRSRWAAGCRSPRSATVADMLGTGLYPRLRDRHLLHHVQSRAGRPLLRAGLRHDAVLAARRRRDQGHLPQADRRAGPCHARRPVLLDRGRMPRRLRQRADGADQQGLLRGPDAGELGAHPRRSESRASRHARPAERASCLRAGRRADHADRSRALCERGARRGTRRRRRGPHRSRSEASGQGRQCARGAVPSRRSAKAGSHADAARQGPHLQESLRPALLAAQGGARARRLGRHQGDDRARATRRSSRR